MARATICPFSANFSFSYFFPPFFLLSRCARRGRGMSLARRGMFNPSRRVKMIVVAPRQKAPAKVKLDANLFYVSLPNNLIHVCPRRDIIERDFSIFADTRAFPNSFVRSWEKGSVPETRCVVSARSLYRGIRTLSFRPPSDRGIPFSCTVERARARACVRTFNIISVR